MAVHVRRLMNRQNFLDVKLGRRVSTQSFVLQYLDKPEEEGVALGLTASTAAVGNSVQRNRARRRLKAAFDEVFRLNPDAQGQGKWLVLVAKSPILKIEHPYLLKDMKKALLEAGFSC
ncbi:MAG: ribonuclease P protein component [Pseudomonas fluorescens]|nr:MAG: ribonuclease P protein component [Pseudomonas fluorescens]